MVYVVRTLDSNGRLRKERTMFYAVRVLDKNGILKKVIKSKLLGQRHWNSFPNKLKTKRKERNNFNTHGKAKDHCSLVRV